MHDPQHILDGMLVLRCFFCKTFQTPIEYDMKVHLRNTHRMELVTKLPLRGKGFDMTYRTDFVIDIIKRGTPPDFYDHRTAKFVSLDKSEMQREGLDANNEENFDSYLNSNVTANNRVTRSI
jgi:hypothetical protein